MTTAPSAPATVTPPWLASLWQRQKATQGEAKAGEAPQGPLLPSCRPKADCRSGFQGATAERRDRTGCPAAGTGVPSWDKPSSPLQGSTSSPHPPHPVSFQQASLPATWHPGWAPGSPRPPVPSSSSWQRRNAAGASPGHSINTGKHKYRAMTPDTLGPQPRKPQTHQISPAFGAPAGPVLTPAATPQPERALRRLV